MRLLRLREKVRIVVLLTVYIALILVGLCKWVFGSDYVNQNGIVYERYVVSVPYSYWWYGKYYTYYVNEYRYRPTAVNYKAPDWRQQMLSIVDRQKEREAFDSALTNLGVSGLFAPKQGFASYQAPAAVPYQAQTPYPSAVGSTYGGFTQLQYARHGDVVSLDVNRAWSDAQKGADLVARMGADIEARSMGVIGNATALQQYSLERVGMIAELQEMKGLIRERAAAERDKALAEKEKMLAEAEVFRSLKPSGSESLTIQQGTQGVAPGVSVQGRVGVGVNGGGYDGSPPPTSPPPGDVPPAPPPNGSHPGAALAVRYCGECHGKDKNAPAMNFYFAEGVPINETQFGALSLRLDPNAPDTRTNAEGRTVPYRMPPSDYAEQPSVEDRRAMVDFGKYLSRAGQ